MSRRGTAARSVATCWASSTSTTRRPTWLLEPTTQSRGFPRSGGRATLATYLCHRSNTSRISTLCRRASGTRCSTWFRLWLLQFVKPTAATVSRPGSTTNRRATRTSGTTTSMYFRDTRTIACIPDMARRHTFRLRLERFSVHFCALDSLNADLPPHPADVQICVFVKFLPSKSLTKHHNLSTLYT